MVAENNQNSEEANNESTKLIDQVKELDKSTVAEKG